MFLVHLSGVKMLNAFSVPNFGQCNVQHPMHENWRLQIDPYAFESLSLCFIYSHGKACDQR
jgi:hypothetical protein